MGYTNICPDKVSLDMTDNEKAGFINTIFHEITHALAFTDSLFPFFINADGTPKVEREYPSLGLMSRPVQERTIDCFDGQSSMTDIFASPDVLCVGYKRNHPIHMICSPEVQRVTREITGCNTVEGAELNWLPSTLDQNTCYGSHWSSYIFNNALMNPSSQSSDETPDNIMMITYALLVDSGWFQVDYRFVQGNPWTNNKGCDFMDEPCIKDGEPTDDNWCISNNGRSGCDPNHFQGKFCSNRSNFPYSDPGCGGITNRDSCLANRGNYCNWVANRCEFHIYPWLKHESDGGYVYGSSAYMEYCPYRSTIHSSRQCVDPDGSCYGYEGCIFGTSSRCAVATALHNNYVPDSEGSARCYDMECADDLMSFTMKATDKSGNVVTATCMEDGEQVEFDSDDFAGGVTCPKRAIICPNSCPNGCMGKGTCQVLDGTPTCICLTGHTGSDCSGFDPEEWMNTDWVALLGDAGDNDNGEDNSGTVETDAPQPTDAPVETEAPEPTNPEKNTAAPGLKQRKNHFHHSSSSPVVAAKSQSAKAQIA